MVTRSGVEAPFLIAQSTTGVTEADGTANIRSPVFTYKVPKGETVVLLPGDTLECYLEDASAQIGNEATIELEVHDAAGQDRYTVAGPTQYTTVKETAQHSLRFKLGIGGRVEVPPRGKLVLFVTDNGAIDASDSRFRLMVHKVGRTVVR